MFGGRMRKSSGKGRRAVAGDPQPPAGGMQIRAAAPCWEDANLAHEILLSSPEAAAWSVDSLLKGIASPDYFAFFGVHGMESTGFILGRLTTGEAEILDLAVRPGSRRRGDATALTEFLLRRFRILGAQKIFLEVRESNQGAISFYDTMGFRPAGTRPNYYRNPVEAAVLLMRSLARES